jgi:phenylpyruvate tautomerase PptA (4-oxalocrotonate tautomerase family)
MPFVRIHLLKGKTEEHLRAISGGVHEALKEAYDIPPDDRFHAFSEYEPSHFVYDAEYLGIHRTDDIVIIDIVAGDWRGTDQKKRLYEALVHHLGHDPGLRPEDVQVVLSSNARDEWSFGCGKASYIKD